MAQRSKAEQLQSIQQEVAFSTGVYEPIVEGIQQGCEIGMKLLLGFGFNLKRVIGFQAVHERCMGKLVDQSKTILSLDVNNLNAKVLSDSFDQARHDQLMTPLQETLAAITAESEADMNEYFALQEETSNLKGKLSKALEEQQELQRKIVIKEQQEEELRRRKAEEEEEAIRLAEEQEAERKRKEEEEEQRRLELEEKKAEAERKRREKAKEQRRLEEKKKAAEAERKRQEDEEEQRRQEEEKKAAEAEKAKRQEEKAEEARQQEKRRLAEEKAAADEAERKRHEKEEKAAKAEENKRVTRQAERKQKEQKSALASRKRQASPPSSSESSGGSPELGAKRLVLKTPYKQREKTPARSPVWRPPQSPSPPTGNVAMAVKNPLMVKENNDGTALLSRPLNTLSANTPAPRLRVPSTPIRKLPPMLPTLQVQKPVQQETPKSGRQKVPEPQKKKLKVPLRSQPLPRQPDLNKTMDTDYDDDNFWGDD